jgi:hypothetical protein
MISPKSNHLVPVVIRLVRTFQRNAPVMLPNKSDGTDTPRSKEIKLMVVGSEHRSSGDLGESYSEAVCQRDPAMESFECSSRLPHLCGKIIPELNA